MPLRLAGQAYLTIQGTDTQGWLREITAQDRTPGLKIDQQGAGRVFDFQDGGISKLYLPDAGDVTMVGSLVFGLANDVTITPTNPAAPRTLTIPDPGASDTFAFLAATQTLTGKTLTSPTVQGTVGAGTGLTLPAFTAGGTVDTASGHLLLDPADGVQIGTGNSAVTFRKKNTQNVSTTAVAVVPSANTEGAMTIVNGKETGVGFIRFIDILLWGRASAPTVIASHAVAGSPAARTYSAVSNTLNLAMASGTYDIMAYSYDAPGAI